MPISGPGESSTTLRSLDLARHDDFKGSVGLVRDRLSTDSIAPLDLAVEDKARHYPQVLGPVHQGEHEPMLDPRLIDRLPSPIRRTIARHAAVAGYAEEIHAAPDAQQRRWIVSAHISSARTYAEHKDVKQGSLPSAVFEEAIRALPTLATRRYDWTPQPKERLIPAKLVPLTGPRPTLDIFDADADHGALLSVDTNIFSAQNSPLHDETFSPTTMENVPSNAVSMLYKKRAFATSVLSAEGCQDVLSPFISIELGARTTPALVRTVGEILADVARQHYPNSYLSIELTNHPYLARMLPRATGVIEPPSRLGYKEAIVNSRDGAISGEATAFRLSCNASGTPQMQTFTGFEERLNVTTADDSQRIAMRYRTEQ